MDTTTGAKKWKLAEARIIALGDGSNGRPEPRVVVDDARSEASPLHGYFDWNDETAADEARLARARQLIRAVRIVVHRGKRTLAAPQYVRDPQRKPEEQGYVDVANVRTDIDMRRDVMLGEIARAASAMARAEAVALALDVDTVATGIQKARTAVAAVNVSA